MTEYGTTSYWSSSVTFPEPLDLAENLSVDCAVIGAGIAGCTAAYLLAKEGKSVVILDRAGIAGGETSRTTAHLAYFLDDRFSELERLFGTEGLRKALLSHKEAIGLIETICQEEAISCDLERVEGHLFNAPEMPQDILQKEYESALRAQINEIRLEENKDPFFESAYVLSLPGQAQFHPLKYIKGLTQAVQKYGGKMYRANVIEVTGGAHAYAITDRGLKVSAGQIIVATNTPINNRFLLHTKQAAYRSYVIAAPIPKGKVRKALYYDTLDPYHYVRLYSTETEDYLIIGGEDHKTGQENDPTQRWQKLENWARERFPLMGSVVHHWSGQIMEPVDSLAFLGKNPLEENVYVISGDSGSGMTHGTLGAIICRDLIIKGESPYADLYDPTRKNMHALSEFTKENANVAAQYGDWLRPTHPVDPEKIPINSGVVIQKNIDKIAVYRDENGELHQLSAVCPHLGCIVNWNDAEKSWDCPCHGSRFTCKGKTINGPAVSDLKTLSL